MELVNRYIYAVTKRLPEKQREDIDKELRSLIDDMLEERSKGSDPTDKDIEDVLLGLGDPSLLADKYRGKNRYLIGPEYFDKYLMLLKIVLAASTFGLIVSLLISYAVTPPDSISSVFSNVISSIFFALFQGFTWVTVIFAFLEFNQVNLKRAKGSKSEFKPSELSQIPSKDARIRRAGPIVGIIFSVILLDILNFSPQLFGIRLNGTGLIPVFNIDRLHSYLLIINISFACVILKQIIRIVYGRYCVPLAIGTIGFSGIWLAITWVVLSDGNLWNTNFSTVLLQNKHVKLPAGFDIMNPMASVAKIIIVLSIFVFAVEAIVTIVKTIKYEVSRL
jgi:hypothetical protein